MNNTFQVQAAGLTSTASVVALDIGVDVKIIKDTFVPLGIPNYKGKPENEHITFEIEIEKSPADKMIVEIRDGSTVYYTETITDTSMLSIGKHEWKWDGFNNSDELDTVFLRTADLNIKVTVELSGHKETAITEFVKQKAIKEKWVDVKIDRSIFEIYLTLRVNLKDGGNDMGDFSKVDPVTIRTANSRGLRQITTPKSFTDLKLLALQGLNYHLSRNAGHPTGQNILVNGVTYQVFVNPVDTTIDSGKAIDLMFNTNGKWKRSGNPAAITDIISLFGNIIPSRVCYNAGFIKRAKWAYDRLIHEDILFAYTAAHEIGHEFTQSFGGTSYSYGHQGSSGVISQKTKSDAPSFLSGSAEIDLMIYYKNRFHINDIQRIIISDNDLQGIIWCSKMKFK